MLGIAWRRAVAKAIDGGYPWFYWSGADATIWSICGTPLQAVLFERAEELCETLHQWMILLFFLLPLKKKRNVSYFNSLSSSNMTHTYQVIATFNMISNELSN